MMTIVQLKSSMQLNKFADWNVDLRIKNAIENTCFKYFLKLPNVKVKIPLQMLAALLHFYIEDEECFVFWEKSDFNLDLGLEDILYITGLPIDGKQVSGIEHKDVIGTIVKHLSITPDDAKGLLAPNRGKQQSFDIDLDKLRDKFEKEAISDENLASHVKAYLLYLLGHLLFNTPSFNTVSLKYLPFLELDHIDSYAWGAAVLATLKVSMGKVSSHKATTLSGFTYALMVFAFERFKCLREIYGFATPCEFPLMVGWANTTNEIFRKRSSMLDGTKYLEKLQTMTDEDVDWCPYERIEGESLLPDQFKPQTWMVYAKVYSICFENIAKNPVHICWKQLGLQLKHLKSGLPKFRKLKLKQRGPTKDKDWRHTDKFYQHCNKRWAERNIFLIKEGLSYDGPLMNYEQGNDDEEENVEEPIQANIGDDDGENVEKLVQADVNPISISIPGSTSSRNRSYGDGFSSLGQQVARELNLLASNRHISDEMADDAAILYGNLIGNGLIVVVQRFCSMDGIEEKVALLEKHMVKFKNYM